MGIADDPLVFMSNNKFLKEKGLKPPASWNDLLNPAYKGMIQMADARTSGTAVTRIFSILEVNGRDENKGFDYMKKLRQNVQVYTKSGGGGTIPVGLAQAGAGIFFIVDALKTQAGGLRRGDLLPEGGDRHLRRGDRPAQGGQESRGRQEADRLVRKPGRCRTSTPSTRSTSSRPIRR